MSGSVIGGEIPALEKLQANFTRQAATVDDLMNSLTSDVNDTWWQGGAADRFRSAWESDYQPALRRLSEALTDASNEVSNRTRMLIEVGS